MSTQPFITVTSVAKSVPFDNTTNGFVATDVQAAIEEARNSIENYYVTDTSTSTTTSATMSAITGMTVTPAAGTYLVQFSGNGSTTSVNGSAEYSIFVGATEAAEARRQLTVYTSILGIITLSVNTIGAACSTMAKVTVNGSQAVTAQFRSANGNTFQIAQKNMILIRVL